MFNVSLAPLLSPTWSKTITKLSISCNPSIEAAAYKQILDSSIFSALTTFSAAQNGLDVDFIEAVSASISDNKTLKLLDLWGNLIGDDGVKKLAEVLSL